jgi:hypothetical protein
MPRDSFPFDRLLIYVMNLLQPIPDEIIVQLVNERISYGSNKHTPTATQRIHISAQRTHIVAQVSGLPRRFHSHSLPK